ncbi:hypothetical protein M434DRAFT_110692 [Hypoxylon sp. CO27-5]|nr:hypothetical protein M434DRAFT_110692 [Hypoxylon sp. CO27-5]
MSTTKIPSLFESSLKFGEAKQDELELDIPHAIENTQKAADLYRSGQKLWIASDLERIEYELAHCKDMPSFTIRRIDGSTVSVKNPMYGVANPIWKPSVTFQDYWYLTEWGNRSAPLRSVLPDSFPCYSYLINWENTTLMDFINDEDPPLDTHFELTKQIWDRSSSCDWLKRKLATVLGARKITKLLCFALGTIAFPSDRSTPKNEKEWYEILVDLLHQQKQILFAHMLALTVAAVAGAATGEEVEVFAQDPAYRRACKNVLEKNGFSVIGEHGAGGLSKIDDNSAVFYCNAGFPVTQIIADIGRPALIIGTGSTPHISTGQGERYVTLIKFLFLVPRGIYLAQLPLMLSI